MNTFNVATQTQIICSDSLTTGQAAKAEFFNATRFFILQRDVKSLPKYIISAIEDAGYTVKRIGGTTYQNSVWALSAK